MIGATLRDAGFAAKQKVSVSTLDRQSTYCQHELRPEYAVHLSESPQTTDPRERHSVRCVHDGAVQCTTQRGISLCFDDAVHAWNADVAGLPAATHRSARATAASATRRKHSPAAQGSGSTLWERQSKRRGLVTDSIRCGRLFHLSVPTGLSRDTRRTSSCNSSTHLELQGW